ncbi:18069_t:CDS:2 [Acaulospora morrowiae]|uniref:Protein PNS1 n=1 Tax=Acaulospora morrowiae TaxID=94023 RepID=A0A9N9EP26_9GLOM|nr:18069_t:CDS:2 [Acaulospora morrowiae]
MSQHYPPQQFYPPTYTQVQDAEYANPYANPYAQNPYNQGPVHSVVAEKWNTKPSYQDLWAVILFLVHLVAFGVFSYIGLKELISKKELDSSISNLHLDSKAIALLAIVIFMGFILSLIYMLLMQRFPKPLITVTLYLSIAIYFITAAVYAYYKQYTLTIIFGIFGLIYLICAFSWRDRIPFAAVMLETVASITKKYYGTIVMGFVGLVLQVGWLILWVMSLVGTYRVFYDKANCSTINGQTTCQNLTPLYIVMIYMLFSFYWTSQVIRTIVHVTNSGVYAAYYFLEGTPQGTGSTPSISSLKRACTTSFGSICFGSLILALLDTIKAIFRIVASNDEGICGFCAACFACLLAWIESLVEYFNHYAYVEVAIYGKSYLRAAKDTWALIKDRGVEAIINDNLVGNVLVMGSILIGVICGLFAFGYIKLLHLPFEDNGLEVFLFVVVCFLLGLTMAIVVTDAIDSGITTTFVALAEDPGALARTKPQLFEKFRQRWPRVVQGI